MNAQSTGWGRAIYGRLLREQEGRCAICGRLEGERRHAVDHDHRTGQLRGLLCFPCNTALGKFGDDPKRLRLAAAYLERWRERAVESRAGFCNCGRWAGTKRCPTCRNP